eukprot:m.115765 g.115765  ORF g.115765 m.115765 type:complete len:107 (+) comp13580_c0_seq1:326-646(+)
MLGLIKRDQMMAACEPDAVSVVLGTDYSLLTYINTDVPQNPVKFWINVMLNSTGSSKFSPAMVVEHNLWHHGSLLEAVVYLVLTRYEATGSSILSRVSPSLPRAAL